MSTGDKTGYQLGFQDKTREIDLKLVSPSALNFSKRNSYASSMNPSTTHRRTMTKTRFPTVRTPVSFRGQMPANPRMYRPGKRPATTTTIIADSCPLMNRGTPR